jgi:two-component system CheB/CheR fusion protein
MAVLAVAAALVARLLLDPLLGDRLPWLLFGLAVVVVAWHGGFGPSFLALLLGLPAAAYFFLPPRYALGPSLAGHGVQVIGFLFLGLAIGVFSERLRASRRRAEAHAREADRRRQELEEEVAGRKRLEQELQRRAEELADADRRKDEFLAMLAHELRNPLAPIRNAVHIMKLVAPADANLERARDVIDRQVQHLARLVDDLLDVSRITRGKIRLHREPVELAATLSRAVETSRPLLDARRHRLTVTLPPEPVLVEGDATRLAQVLANLLNNAAKYTGEDGAIGVRVEREGDEAVVRVRDNGSGIPAELLPRVFDLFTQGDRSLARSEGGLGIGLTLVKRLVEMHGGSVTGHSDGPGHGSEFVVRLPALERSRAPAPGDAAGSGRPMPRRVLVVDDSEDAAESLATVLRIGGHEVCTAYDGPAALRTAEAFRPEVVLLDIGLPGMDGFEVGRRLREQTGMRRALLVAVTGYGQEEDRRRAEQVGFDAHLVKPADLSALERLLAGPEGKP